MVQFDERRLQEVACTDRHPAARVKVAVWHYRNQRIASGAVMRSSPGNKKLECPMHCYLGSAEQTAFRLSASTVHNLEELSRLIGVENRRL